MRLLLMIHGLGAGGAERVLTLLADGLASKGHEVHLLTLAAAADDFFVPGSAVRRIRLNVAGESKGLLSALQANLRRVLAIRREVCATAPHAIISFTTTVNVLALIACAGVNAPVIVSERVDPCGHVIRWRWQVLRRLSYRRAHALVAQTDRAAEWFRRWLPARVFVTSIANIVALDAKGPVGAAVPGPYILAAGRLVHQKGFDVLIEAFSHVAPNCPRLNLAIAGEGPEAASLERLAQQRGLAKRVFFLGRVKALGAVMRQAYGFVLSSRYEGFPNVLVEALAAGIPVVSTDCPSGPREILDEGRHGLLVPPEDPTALSSALVRIATDKELRARLSAAGPECIARYRAEVVIAQWEELLSRSWGR